jgi:hypothetical protein
MIDSFSRGKIAFNSWRKGPSVIDKILTIAGLETNPLTVARDPATIVRARQSPEILTIRSG